MPYSFLITHHFQPVKSGSKCLQDPVQQAHLWSGALKAKKTALENLVKAQKSLEEIEEAIAEHLPMQSIEGAHTQFLSTLQPCNPEAVYMLTVGRVVIHPLSACISICSGGR